MEVRVDGKLGLGVTAKDIILGIIGRITTDGGTGYVIEYRGSAIEALSMEERMTVCNMSIEGGARAGMIAADRKTVDYLRGRRYLPSGAEFDRLAAQWLTYRTDDGAKFDRSITFDAAAFRPASHLGHQPRHGDRGHRQGARSVEPSPTRPRAARPNWRSNTWGSRRARAITDVKVDRVFIGSCTNARVSRPAGGRRDRQGPPRRLDRSRDGRAGLAAGQE